MKLNLPATGDAFSEFSEESLKQTDRAVRNSISKLH